MQGNSTGASVSHLPRAPRAVSPSPLFPPTRQPVTCAYCRASPPVALCFLTVTEHFWRVQGVERASTTSPPKSRKSCPRTLSCLRTCALAHAHCLSDKHGLAASAPTAGSGWPRAASAPTTAATVQRIAAASLRPGQLWLPAGLLPRDSCSRRGVELRLLCWAGGRNHTRPCQQPSTVSPPKGGRVRAASLIAHHCACRRRRAAPVTFRATPHSCTAATATGHPALATPGSGVAGRRRLGSCPCSSTLPQPPPRRRRASRAPSPWQSA